MLEHCPAQGKCSLNRSSSYFGSGVWLRAACPSGSRGGTVKEAGTLETQDLTLALISHVVSRKLVHLLEPQFPCLKWVIVGFCERLQLEYMAACLGRTECSGKGILALFMERRWQGPGRAGTGARFHCRRSPLSGPTPVCKATLSGK